MSMKIERSSLELAFKDLRKLYKRLDDTEWRRDIMGPPAELVKDAARKRQKDANAAHYYYKNRTPGKRRPRNSALTDRVKIHPGNLRLSIQHLRKLRKTPFAVVGPNIKSRLGNLKNLGRTERNTSGFYAWMAQRTYSGAESFRKDIMEPALQEATPRILAYIDRQATKRIEQIKNQLSVFR